MAGRHSFKYLLLISLVGSLLYGCENGQWNNPYRDGDQHKDIIYTSFKERPKELDPVKSYNAAEYDFIAQIYEPPLQYHFLKRPYQLIPLAASKMPTRTFFDENDNPLSADVEPSKVAYTIYNIEIQPGIQYQPHAAFAKDPHGAYYYHSLAEEDLEDVNILADFEQQSSRQLTAQDYVYQIKRLAHPNLHSPLAGLLGNYIEGFTEYREKVLANIEDKNAWLDLRTLSMQGVTVLDSHHFSIRVKGVYPQFIYWLNMPFFAPIPWEADKFYSQVGMKERNISFDWYPVGTGPYMLTENNPNLRMVLERNPNFHGEKYPSEGEPEDYALGLLDDAGKELPFADRIVFSLEKESIPYWNKFLQGYYDTSGISSDSFDQSVELNSQGEFGLTEEMEKRDIDLASAVATSLYYLGFNMGDTVIGGKSERARLLRRAISIAVDYDEFISIFQNGRGIPAQGPIPPGIFGNESGEAGLNSYVYNWKNDQPVRKSIDEAKELMKKARYQNGVDQETGKPLVLYFDTVSRGADTKALLNWMMKQFAKIDIQLVIRGSDANRFYDKLDKGTFQIYQLGWNADYPDPENFFFLLYGPNSISLSGGQNYSNYQNQEFDKLFDVMKNMPNGPERLNIIRQMNDIVRIDAPWIFSFNPKSYSLYHDWYKNVKPNLMANNTMKYKRVDPVLRAQSREKWNQPILWPIYLLIVVLVLTIIPAVRGFYQRERAKAL
jgi:oligopeptide transport system substrate-binding protein